MEGNLFIDSQKKCKNLNNNYKVPTFFTYFVVKKSILDKKFF